MGVLYVQERHEDTEPKVLLTVDLLRLAEGMHVEVIRVAQNCEDPSCPILVLVKIPGIQGRLTQYQANPMK